MATPLAGTPVKPPYDCSKLVWNKQRTRNNKRQYSYSGKTKDKACSLRCSHCGQWFYMDEINRAELLPPGFLDHQRNYRFGCAWCNSSLKVNSGSASHDVATSAIRVTSAARAADPSWVEQFQLTKPKKFEAIVDAFLNMMATADPRRKEFKVSEVKDYLLAHWETLLTGWEPPRELTGEGKPFDIAPYFNKKGEFTQLRKPYWQLTDQRPFQPFEMLLPHENWQSPPNTYGSVASPSVVDLDCTKQAVDDTDGGELVLNLQYKDTVSRDARAATGPRSRGNTADNFASSVGHTDRAYLPDGVEEQELYNHDNRATVQGQRHLKGEIMATKRARIHVVQQQQERLAITDALSNAYVSNLANAPVPGSASSAHTQSVAWSQKTSTVAVAGSSPPPIRLLRGIPLQARQQYEAEHRRLQSLPPSPDLPLQEHPLSETSLVKQHFHPDNCLSTALKLPGMAIERGFCGGLLPVGPIDNTSTHISRENLRGQQNGQQERQRGHQHALC